MTIGATCYNIMLVATRRNWLSALTIATYSRFGRNSAMMNLFGDLATMRLCGTVFSGSTLIPNDAYLPSSTPNSNMREPVMEKTWDPKRDEEQRERNAKIDQNLSEATTITFKNNDFSPEPAYPIEPYFTLTPSSKLDIEEDLAVNLVHRNHHKLAVLHESFVHLSFSILNLMDRSGLIP